MQEINTTYFLIRTNEFDANGIDDIMFDTRAKYDSADKAIDALNELLEEYGQRPIKYQHHLKAISVPIVSEPGLHLQIASLNQPIIQPYENY